MGYANERVVRIPGSLKLVLKRLDNVKTNVRPDTTGM